MCNGNYSGHPALPSCINPAAQDMKYYQTLKVHIFALNFLKQ